MDFHEHLLFPFRDADWVRKLLLGCVVTLIPIVNILTLGYFIACLNMGLKGRQVLPEWQDWSRLLQDGLQGIIISLSYLGVPLLLSGLMLAVPGIGSLLSAVLLLILGLLLPIAIAAYSVSGDLRNAFRLGEIFYQANRILADYISAYVTTAFVLCLGLALNLLVPWLSVVGSLLIFYTGAVFFNLVGLLLRNEIHG